MTISGLREYETKMTFDVKIKFFLIYYLIHSDIVS